MLGHFQYEEDADVARKCAHELVDLSKARGDAYDFPAIIDCADEIVVCVNRLEEEIRSLRREVNNLTDSRWDDPHP
jgi:hypothetical protein